MSPGAQLAKLLPETWHARWSPGEARDGFDGTLSITNAQAETVPFDVEAKARFEPRDIGSLVAHFAARRARNPLLFSRFLSARARELLIEHAISYVDATGNVRITSPALFVQLEGARKDPERNAVPRSSLRGPVTGRIVRYLCETKTPFTVSDIARSTDSYTGNISRVLEYLEREHLIERGARGAVRSVSWTQLIEVWARALEADRIDMLYLEPHGIDATLERLHRMEQPYALTGQFASARLAPIAPSVALDIYVADIESAAKTLELREGPNIGNVRLIRAFDRVAFERTLEYEGLNLAGPAQIAADLLTLPHRSRDEYSALIDWMKEHTVVWRR